MSDSDATPDPMDKAYAEAEAMLGDEAARAARRARVLVAVAAEPAAAAASAPSVHGSAWRRGGWLAAACVAGLSLLVVLQSEPPVPLRQPAAPPAPAAPQIAAPPPPAASTPTPAPEAASPSRAVEFETPSPGPAPVAPAPPPPAPPPAADVAPAPAMPPAAPASRSSAEVEELVVTESRAERRASAPVAGVRSVAPDRVARLHAAAAAGRTGQVGALLAAGVPVDAPDDKGDTALMKAIQEGHPTTAALLRRRGASLDRKNRAGDSARDMAKSAGDAELNRALGLDR